MSKNQPKTPRQLVEDIDEKLKPLLTPEGVGEWNREKSSWVRFAEKYIRIQHWYARKQAPEDGKLLKEYKNFSVFVVKRIRPTGKQLGVSALEEKQLYFVVKKEKG